MSATQGRTRVVLTVPFAAAILTLACSTLAAQDSSSLPAAPDLGRATSREVRAVIDECTLLVGDGREEWRVRLLGVASPRWSEAAAEARLFLERLLGGESVYLVGPGDASGVGPEETERTGVASQGTAAKDPAERAAYVYRAPDGLFVNLELVRQGYAPVAARERFEHRALFRAWEERARMAEKGIWGRPERPASQPRQTEQERPKRTSASSQPSTRTHVKLVYVTRSGEKYHLPDCPALRGSGRAIPIEEARKRYTPCSRCKPPP